MASVERFRKWYSKDLARGFRTSRRHVHLLATVKLERFPASICEILLKSDARKDSAEILSRVLTARFDAEFQFRKQDRRHSTTDLFRLNCLDYWSTNVA